MGITAPGEAPGGAGFAFGFALRVLSQDLHCPMLSMG